MTKAPLFLTTYIRLDFAYFDIRLSDILPIAAMFCTYLVLTLLVINRFRVGVFGTLVALICQLNVIES